jgi:hypothetical protein
LSPDLKVITERRDVEGIVSHAASNDADRGGEVRAGQFADRDWVEWVQWVQEVLSR